MVNLRKSYKACHCFYDDDYSIFDGFVSFRSDIIKQVKWLISMVDLLSVKEMGLDIDEMLSLAKTNQSQMSPELKELFSLLETVLSKYPKS